MYTFDKKKTKNLRSQINRQSRLTTNEMLLRLSRVVVLVVVVVVVVTVRFKRFKYKDKSRVCSL